MTDQIAPPPQVPVAASPQMFDTLPYPSLPLSYTQPARLAALAQIHGVMAPPAANARVLELGCAAGGNIIPLAARFPKAEFVGVDLSTRHIADGQHRIAALGLANITLHAGDVTTLLAAGPMGGKTFDYIICHGLFSWVPNAARDAILQICREKLAPSGVAAISYNVLPGWHLRRAIRDICIVAAGTSGTPLERATRARRAIDNIANCTSKKLPYGYFLRQESMRLRQQPLAYIYGEFLGENNTPCTFTEFAGRAAAHDLEFLCEGDLDASALAVIDDAQAFSKLLPKRDSLFAIGRGQTVDFVSGRPFRRSLVVHAFAGAKPLQADAKRLRGLYILRGATESRFASVDDAFPNSVAVDSLIASLNEEDGFRVCEMLLAAVVAGQGTISTLPVRAGRPDISKPLVSALNRIEAASGQPWLSSMHHEAVPMSTEQALLVRELDGKRDRAALAAAVTSAPREQNQTAAEFVDATLAYLEREAVLLA